MIEIINPALLSIVVDNGRNGFAHIGVPSSSALDGEAFRRLNELLANNRRWPCIEVIGAGFALKFRQNLFCAITGARVKASVNDNPIADGTAIPVSPGDVLRVRDVMEGFRYYVGFSGRIDCNNILGSYTTNIECRFGGFNGRPLAKGDRIALVESHPVNPDNSRHPFDPMPMGPPHILRIIAGPEWRHFEPASLSNLLHSRNGPWYTVSPSANRTGIRLEGAPLAFRAGFEKSIISDGLFPGTVQIPGDGLPIIVLAERTIGGYARIAVVAAIDLYRLAHLKPGDPVSFELINIDNATELLRRRGDLLEPG